MRGAPVRIPSAAGHSTPCPAYAGSAPSFYRAAHGHHEHELDEWGRSADPVMVVEAIGGTGKSALTWQWAQDRAPEAVGRAGRAAVVELLRGLRVYDLFPARSSRLHHGPVRCRGRPAPRPRPRWPTRSSPRCAPRPYVLVLDGFEGLLVAYHRFDPSKLRDEEGEPDERALIEPDAEDLVCTLTTAGPSRILISTRLMPARAARPVRHSDARCAAPAAPRADRPRQG